MAFIIKATKTQFNNNTQLFGTNIELKCLQYSILGQSLKYV